MDLSLGELEALCRKAARGAGLDWGPAEEAGHAARWLAAVALPGPELLLARLVARDGVPAAALSPRSLDGEWRSGGEALCPILAGAVLTDAAEQLGDRGEIVLHDVLAPLLVVPFAAAAARRLGRPVSVAWGTLAVVVVVDGARVRIDGAHASVRDELATTVRCRTLASEDGVPGEALPPRTRADVDRACLEGLETLALRTCAPATEESRARGAGGATIDDG